MSDTVTKKTPGRIVVGTVIAVALPVLAVVACTAGSAGSGSNAKYEAIAQCESRIEDQLRSPGTAVFDSTATGYETWTVTGSVDSENGFGALLRSDYQCTVELDGNTATTTIDFIR